MSDANVEISAEEKARLEKLNAEFLKAKDNSEVLPKKPSNDEKLKLYSLYKQGTVGDNNTEKPSAFSFERKYMWDAWTKLKGMKPEEAKQQYIDFVKELEEKFKEEMK
ncbi:acyl-CoA-binding protein (ACBP)/diazepam binding inhibitor (DBI)/endozepine (EP) [Coemansia guatemalensis]|uniref:Acyl-CoA-binding protein (ACBP)/diazepam binding inhibitor (DBI)/endozepine (EP) n=1 Tax=Coemansia guatemalensis TaxID=2761395 RepID=A0A9W8HPM9_9FUNG|nr:acyl-CoA-binding protein (ACBP)/diazepam binding inhibitor (DBI)/endozepine (EP) [Coemansia guatemalensis]